MKCKDANIKPVCYLCENDMTHCVFENFINWFNPNHILYRELYTALQDISGLMQVPNSIYAKMLKAVEYINPEYLNKLNTIILLK